MELGEARARDAREVVVLIVVATEGLLNSAERLEEREKGYFRVIRL